MYYGISIAQRATRNNDLTYLLNLLHINLHVLDILCHLADVCVSDLACVCVSDLAHLTLYVILVITFRVNLHVDFHAPFHVSLLLTG